MSAVVEYLRQQTQAEFEDNCLFLVDSCRVRYDKATSMLELWINQSGDECLVGALDIQGSGPLGQIDWDDVRVRIVAWKRNTELGEGLLQNVA